jgi:hypothetical protein
LERYRKTREEQKRRNDDFIAGYVWFIKLYQNIKIPTRRIFSRCAFFIHFTFYIGKNNYQNIKICKIIKLINQYH